MLLALASVAVLAYTWGRGAASLETYYGAAVRSMSQSWRNFFFGAFDPWGTITLDKLPGAFWLQALAVRAGGFHPWVVALPQAIEGGLTVLVLFRAVRRVAGAGAGVAAAAVLVASPAVILLDRGNVPDTLLILLLVLAADATTAAFVTGRTGCLLTAGLWVGLAFQAKMLEAWTVLPALSIAYLLAAPAAPLARRMGHTALFLLAALAVSLSYMAVVTAVPPQDRPYVDGSCNNSIVSQVFQYNGLDRSAGSALDRPGCNPTPAPTAGGPGGQSARSAPLPRGPARFLTGGLAREIDWMLVPALVSFAGVVMLRRREPRTDPVRASAVLWGGWLFFMWSSFASSHHLNDYYFAALGPPIAALCALGISSAWRTRHRRGTLLIVGGTVVAGTAYALALVPSNAGVRPWVLTTSLLLALLASTSLAWSLTSRPRWLPGVGVMLAAGALLAGSAWASGTAAVAGLGPFDAPYQPEAVTQQEHAAAARAAALAPALVAAASHVPPGVSVITDETSAGSALAAFETGREFLPVGGFTGRAPSPTLPQFLEDVRLGKVTTVLVAVAPETRSPDLLWVVSHCRRQPTTGPDSHIAGRSMSFYQCTFADATRRG